jgi:hypothetical protein
MFVEVQLGRPGVKVIDRDKLVVGKSYFGYVFLSRIFRAKWDGDMFIPMDSALSAVAPLQYPTENYAKEIGQTFLPVAVLNEEHKTYSVKYTMLVNDRANTIQYFRRGLPYYAAIDCAQGIASALGLKCGLPYGLHWLTVMPCDVEETIDIEEEK